MVDDSDEVIVGTEQGVFKVRSTKRLPIAKRSNPQRLEKTKGVPWCLVPSEAQAGSGELTTLVAGALGVPEDELPVVPRPVPDREGARRRIRIRRDVELVKFGYTEGCNGCDHARAGLPTADHSEARRARIETAMPQEISFEKKLRFT